MSSSQLEPLARIKRDVKMQSDKLSENEARYLVDSYYSIQDFRIASGNQVRALADANEENATIIWFNEQFDTLENQIKAVLDVYSISKAVGVWARSNLGIGPVLSAGLLAHIDITKANTAGKIWSFAGLDPNKVWEKGQKRPWNAQLKTLCWKIGESFVKVSGREESLYGRLYRERKDREIERNVAGKFADQANAALTTKSFKKGTVTRGKLEEGKLSDAHIHARAKRYAVKIFLSHFHEAAYFSHYGEMPPRPFALAHMEHVDYIAPLNRHYIEGWEEASVRSPR